MPPDGHNPEEPRSREMTPAGTPGPSSQAAASSVPASPTTPSDRGETTLVPPVWPLPPQQALPRPFGAYELLERLGKGGMGVVYRARDLSLGREVALKMLRGRPFEDEHGVARFFLEARAAARLDHPHIVPVYEVDEHDGQHYYTMRLLAGSVAQQRERFAGDSRAAVALMEKVARAVHFAHEHGVLHRDLKPGNILLDDQGEPLVSDFGLAKMLDVGMELTQSGVPVGTVPYMPPEQAAGKREQITAVSDVWSLGVTLYELLTGVRPFAGDSQEEILSQIKSSQPTPPRKLQPKLDRDLETICLKCLEKEPKDRYATAGALAEDLHSWLEGTPIRARPGRRLVHVGRFAKRHKWTLALAGAFLCSTVLALWPILFAPDSGDYRLVEINTQPPGAAVLFVPLDADTGEPQESNGVRLKSDANGPAKAKLAPGDYLVETELAGHGFHQVYRRVPRRQTDMPRGYPHVTWQEDGDVVKLSEIVIPSSANVADMAFFEGSDSFIMGSEKFPTMAPPHRRPVSPFYLDCHEVTVDEFRKVMGGLPDGLSKNPPPDNFAVPRVSYDAALRYAELVGKRLPTEAEYEFAATLGGKRDYPWGDDPGLIKGWSFGPIQEPAYDVTKTTPPVYGLYSNVGEWTVTWPTLYPGAPFGWLPEDYRRTRIVRGAGMTTIMKGEGPQREWFEGPRMRRSFSTNAAHPGLGFRCARDKEPRFLRNAP